MPGYQGDRRTKSLPDVKNPSHRTQRLHYLQQRAAEAEENAGCAPLGSREHLTKLAQTWRMIADDYAEFFRFFEPRSKL